VVPAGSENKPKKRLACACGRAPAGAYRTTTSVVIIYMKRTAPAPPRRFHATCAHCPRPGPGRRPSARPVKAAACAAFCVVLVPATSHEGVHERRGSSLSYFHPPCPSLACVPPVSDSLQVGTSCFIPLSCGSQLPIVQWFRVRYLNFAVLCGHRPSFMMITATQGQRAQIL